MAAITKEFPKIRSRLTGDFLKLYTDSAEERCLVVQLLKRLKFQFYTKNAKAERPIKVVIKGLPRTTNPEEIKQDLEMLGYTPERVNQLIGRKTKRALPIFLITLPRNLDNLKNFDLKTLSYLSIRVEGYDGKGVTQCYTCNNFNHSSENCYLNPRCLKCGENHITRDCPIKQILEAAYCINCQIYGHMVRVYRPRQTDTISSDSQVETLYDEQEVSHGSNRSNQGQFKEHRKTSSKESEGCRSRQGNTAREIKNKRKMSNNESKDQVLKRSKMCMKRSLQGSEHKDRKRLAPEQRQGVKRSIPSSISSRTYKLKRPNTSSQGVESIAGPSRLPDCRLNKSTTVESRTEGSGRDNKTRQTRATTRDATNKRRDQSGRIKPLQGDLAHTIYAAE
ncbi:nucleic-acid-binding protein from transposon X-element [Trichonephila clavipes]|nr:nucleic-acid-binding protein from transposon X-element [Trichonephila clavipes]